MSIAGLALADEGHRLNPRDLAEGIIEKEQREIFKKKEKKYERQELNEEKWYLLQLKCGNEHLESISSHWREQSKPQEKV